MFPNNEYILMQTAERHGIMCVSYQIHIGYYCIGDKVQKPDYLRVRVGDEVFEFDLDSQEKVAVIQTEVFGKWIDGIGDIRTNARIIKDVGKMRRGIFGDWKEVDEGVFEMRLDYGPGYRVYYARVGKIIVVLLGGGDKSTQKADIMKAQKLWKELKNEIT